MHRLSSLTVYYEFDSASGTNVIDLSGNSNNATLDGTSWATNQGVYTTVTTTGTRDTDGDGFTDAVEIAGGSLATDATSIPDSTPPTLTNVGVESNNSDTGIASNGDTVSVSFEASEAVDTPTVSINGQSAVVTARSGANSYTATITVPNYKVNVSTLAGQVGVTGYVDDQGSDAKMTYPYGIAFDSVGTLLLCRPIESCHQKN